MSGADETVGSPAAAMVGEWRNSNAETEWIERFIISDGADGPRIEVWARQPPFHWGSARLDVFADNIGELAFAAQFVADCAPGVRRDSWLAANSNQGLIVIAAFHRFEGPGAPPNFLCREFYYR